MQITAVRSAENLSPIAFQFGADVELVDGQGCLPASITGSYEIRFVEDFVDLLVAHLWG